MALILNLVLTGNKKINGLNIDLGNNMRIMQKLFHKKVSFEESPESHSGLKRTLSTLDLIFLGIGAIIGAGIFVMTGIVASTHAGPGVILSYIIAGLATGFCALSYAELASSVGGCGSAYGYSYVAFGEFIAWIIGWDLILEYGFAGVAVAIGWGSYLNDILVAMGIHLPWILCKIPSEGGWINILPMIILLIITAVLALGASVSARVNNVIVFIKLFSIVLFIVLAAQNVHIENWSNFLPFGWTGVMEGAALIFFAYLGFDAVSTATEEAINPQRSIPIAIMTSLLVCTALYVAVSGLATLIVPYTSLNVASPLSQALLHLGYRFGSALISAGAIAGLTTVILVVFYGLTRILFAMSRDGLLPAKFSEVASSTGAPVKIIIICGSLMAFVSGTVSMHLVAELINLGTLAAFCIVSIGVIVLRYRAPNMHRPFRSPLGITFPILGILACLYLMIYIPSVTWLRLVIWFIIGVIIYFSYGFRRVHRKN